MTIMLTKVTWKIQIQMIPVLVTPELVGQYRRGEMFMDCFVLLRREVPRNFPHDCTRVNALCIKECICWAMSVSWVSLWVSE